MTHLAATVSPKWLSLREPADHAARSHDLVSVLMPQLPNDLVIHDLGSGTGSMTRWLAPQLYGPQRWVLHDRDDELLARAVTRAPLSAADGSDVRIGTRTSDITALSGSDLADAALVTASALLDLLTADELSRIATVCVNKTCPALFTLTVTGKVRLTPPHRLDAVIRSAFNAHQRRVVAGRRLLGPHAVTHTADSFARLGAHVVIRDSPWRLGADDLGLVVEWLTGWVGAACEQRPELADPARAYLVQRLADAAAGRLHITVGHADVLATPPDEPVEPFEPFGRDARVAARRE